MSSYLPNHNFRRILDTASSRDASPDDLEAIAAEAVRFREKAEEILRAVALNENSKPSTILKVASMYPGLALSGPTIRRMWREKRSGNVVEIARRFVLRLCEKIDRAWVKMESEDKSPKATPEVADILNRVGWYFPGTGIVAEIRAASPFEAPYRLASAMEDIVVLERFCNRAGEGFVYPAEAATFVSKELGRD